MSSHLLHSGLGCKLDEGKAQRAIGVAAQAAIHDFAAVREGVR